MNSRKAQYLLRFFLVALSFSMFACAKKNDSSVRLARGSAVGVSQNNTNGVSTCSNTSMDWGRIYDLNGAAQFEAQVKGFVSATLDPQSFGAISGDINASTGIDFKGSFKFDAQGALESTSSSVEIKIIDSYVNLIFDGEVVEPYVVQFTQAQSGRLDRATGKFTVTFQDSFGAIVFQGVVADQMAEGTVTYQNTKAVAGSTIASGNLGQFKSYACALIK